MQNKRRSNNGMNNGGQHRHHNNNRTRRFNNNGGRSENDAGNIARTRRNAQQNKEKYQNMARDALAGGDRVLAENYLQHADHYHRVILSLPPEETPRQHNHSRNHAEHAASGENQSHEIAEAGVDVEAQEGDAMPNADALPSFITQPIAHTPQNLEE